MSAPPRAVFPAVPLTAPVLAAWKRPGLKGPALNLCFASICLCGLILNIWIMVIGRIDRGIDFNQFYSAGRLAGTGHLYDWTRLRSLELQRNNEAPTARLPIVAYGHKILGRLPYETARDVWLLASIVALMIAAFIWPDAPRLPTALAIAASAPAAMSLYSGQDVAFWLLFYAVGLLLLRKNRPIAAGIAFSLCIPKYHLAVGIPILLIATRNWKALAAGAAATLALLASCFLIEGPGWPRHYLEMLQLSQFSPAPQRMPTLYGLASWTPGAHALEAAAGAVVAWLLYCACRRTAGTGFPGAAAAASGLLLGHHAFALDCALLVPLLTLTIFCTSTSAPLQAWALLLVSPAPALLLGSPFSWLGQLMAVGFVIAALLALNFSSKLCRLNPSRLPQFTIEVSETELLQND
jgi:Glycosyltransferase family 87